MGAKKAVIAGVFGICMCSSVAAQQQSFRNLLHEQAGTFSVTPNPVFAGGNLVGCTVTFVALIQDYTYRKGQYIRVDGSFGYMARKSDIAISLKVLVNDINESTMDMTPATPASAYFISPDGLSTTAQHQAAAVPSDTSGAILIAYGLEPVGVLLMQAMNDDKITIAFAREKGGSDIRIPLDLTVKETLSNGKKIRDPSNMLPVLNCTQKLFARFSKPQ